MKAKSAKEATFCNERNLGAIISITLVMSAVFIPVSFLSGPVFTNSLQ
jgi:HAE1 family hydrophobic/amphiphilic exporter-1